MQHFAGNYVYAAEWRVPQDLWKTLAHFCPLSAVIPKDVIITCVTGRRVIVQSRQDQNLKCTSLSHQLKHDVQISAILVYAQNHDPKFQRKAILLCQSEVEAHN